MRTDRRALLGALSAALLAGCAQPPVLDEKVARPLVFPPPPDEPRFIYERTIRSSGDVVSDETGDFRRLLTGESQRGEPLSKPYAVAVFRGRSYRMKGKQVVT